MWFGGERSFAPSVARCVRASKHCWHRTFQNEGLAWQVAAWSVYDNAHSGGRPSFRLPRLGMEPMYPSAPYHQLGIRESSGVLIRKPRQCRQRRHLTLPNDRVAVRFDIPWNLKKGRGYFFGRPCPKAKCLFGVCASRSSFLKCFIFSG